MIAAALTEAAFLRRRIDPSWLLCQAVFLTAPLAMYANLNTDISKGFFIALAGAFSQPSLLRAMAPIASNLVAFIRRVGGTARS